MGKKIAKFLLFLTTVGAAFAGACYFMKNKSSALAEEDDYDDLDDDSYEVMDDDSSERSYVSLNPDTTDTASDAADSKPEAADVKSGTTIEEFFDDDDDDGSLDAI